MRAAPALFAGAWDRRRGPSAGHQICATQETLSRASSHAITPLISLPSNLPFAEGPSLNPRERRREGGREGEEPRMARTRW